LGDSAEHASTQDTVAVSSTPAVVVFLMIPCLYQWRISAMHGQKETAPRALTAGCVLARKRDHENAFLRRLVVVALHATDTAARQ
jgi:hypothetical protein